MNYFFEKKDLLIIHMTNYLIETNRKKILLATLAKQMAIDKRALTSLVYQYNYIELSQCGLHLEIEDDYLLCTRQPDFSYNYLHCLILQKTLLFKLCQAFLTQTFPGISQFSNEHFISTSSMYRRLNQLKTVLNEYHLSLNLTDDNYILGEEKQIRHFYFELYYAAYGLDTDYLIGSHADKDRINKHIQEQLTPNSFSFLQKTKLATYVTLSRLKNGYYLPKSLFDHNHYEQLVISDGLKQYSQAILKPYVKNNDLLVAEATFLSVYLITFDVIVDEKSQLLTHLTMNHSLSHPKLAWRWINQLMSFFNMQLSANDCLFLYVNLHYNFFKTDLLNNASINNLDSQKTTSLLKKDDPYVFAKTFEFIRHIGSQKDFLQSNYLNMLYYFLMKEVIYLNRTVSIFVFSSASTLQKQHIEKMITNLSPVTVQFSDELTNDLDIIVSDYSSPHHNLFLKKDTITVITNTFPTKKNYESILKAILTVHDSYLTKQS